MENIRFRAIDILREACGILNSQGDRNWIRGIENVLRELESGNIDDAASIYRSMVAGGRGFSEYNVWIDHCDDRIKVNQRLDCIRDELWDIFKI